MYDPPAYVWALTIGGPAAIAAATCIALYSGAVRAGLGRRRDSPAAPGPLPAEAHHPAKTAERTSHAVHRNR